MPEDILNYSGSLIFTTRKEAPINSFKIILDEEVYDKHPTLIRGLIFQKLDYKFDKNELIIGIDPGKRIGLSIFYYEKEIENSLYHSVNDLVSHVTEILAGLPAIRKIVKIGNGNMEIAKQISNSLNLKYCSDFELEFVNESSTTLKIKNHNQGGKRDMLSARHILKRNGFCHMVLPISRTG